MRQKATISYRKMRSDRAKIGSYTIRVDSPASDRPMTRGECRDAERPCPYVSCKWHLYLDVKPNGGIRLNWPGLEPWEIPETCALDVADRGGEDLEAIAAMLNLTRERVRQIATASLARVSVGLCQFWQEESSGGRRPVRHLIDPEADDGTSDEEHESDSW